MLYWINAALSKFSVHVCKPDFKKEKSVCVGGGGVVATRYTGWLVNFNTVEC